MTRPGIEPRSPRPLANTLPTRPMSELLLLAIVTSSKKSFRQYTKITSILYDFSFVFCFQRIWLSFLVLLTFSGCMLRTILFITIVKLVSAHLLTLIFLRVPLAVSSCLAFYFSSLRFSVWSFLQGSCDYSHLLWAKLSFDLGVTLHYTN